MELRVSPARGAQVSRIQINVAETPMHVQSGQVLFGRRGNAGGGKITQVTVHFRYTALGSTVSTAYKN